MDPYAYRHRHLLGIEGLTREDITYVLDLADSYVEMNRQTEKKKSLLRGRTLINCFFENSTRTRTSFEVAGKRLGADVINAGDGNHEHPTQALLDALTIRRRKGKLGGLSVAICGDVLHSRVARSNIALLNAVGARVRVVAPRTLLPAAVEHLGVEVFHDMAEGLADVDIVMMLRLQSERMHGSF